MTVTHSFTWCRVCGAVVAAQIVPDDGQPPIEFDNFDKHLEWHKKAGV